MRNGPNAAAGLHTILFDFSGASRRGFDGLCSIYQAFPMVAFPSEQRLGGWDRPSDVGGRPFRALPSHHARQHQSASDLADRLAQAAKLQDGLHDVPLVLVRDNTAPTAGTGKFVAVTDVLILGSSSFAPRFVGEGIALGTALAVGLRLALKRSEPRFSVQPPGNVLQVGDDHVPLAPLSSLGNLEEIGNAGESGRLPWTTGWRIDEILSLRKDDLDLETGRVTTRAADNKGRRDDTDYLPASALAMVKGIVGFQPHVFPWLHDEKMLWVEFRRIQEAAGIKLPCPQADRHKCSPLCGYYGFHAIRRAYATLNCDTMPASVLQAKMWHKSFSTTQRYISLANKMKQASQAVYVPDFLRKTASG